MKFIKYSVTGNDFILFDVRDHKSDQFVKHLSPSKSVQLCHRQFGIGADGILLVGNSKVADVSMAIINSDGSEASMCGNGLRAILDYVGKERLSIETKGGTFIGRIDSNLGPLVEVSCNDDVKRVVVGGDFVDGHYVVCGVPHIVIMVEDVEDLDVNFWARPLRERFDANINFFQIVSDNEIVMRTYERGVGETLACGSGASAVGVVLRDIFGKTGSVKAKLKGGEVTLILDKTIHLCGKADKIFFGNLD